MKLNAKIKKRIKKVYTSGVSYLIGKDEETECEIYKWVFWGKKKYRVK